MTEPLLIAALAACLIAAGSLVVPFSFRIRRLAHAGSAPRSTPASLSGEVGSTQARVSRGVDPARKGGSSPRPGGRSRVRRGVFENERPGASQRPGLVDTEVSRAEYPA